MLACHSDRNKETKECWYINIPGAYSFCRDKDGVVVCISNEAGAKVRRSPKHIVHQSVGTQLENMRPEARRQAISFSITYVSLSSNYQVYSVIVW